MNSDLWLLVAGGVIALGGALIERSVSRRFELQDRRLEREWQLQDRQRERHDRVITERLLTIRSQLDDTLKTIAGLHYQLLDTGGDPEAEVTEEEIKRADIRLDKMRIGWSPTLARIVALNDEILRTRWKDFGDSALAWVECYGQLNTCAMGDALKEVEVAAGWIMERLDDLELRIPAESEQTVTDQD